MGFLALPVQAPILIVLLRHNNEEAPPPKTPSTFELPLAMCACPLPHYCTDLPLCGVVAGAGCVPYGFPT